MKGQPSGWGPDFIQGASPRPHWHRRWLSNEPKMNIVRCPQVPNDVYTMQCFSFSKTDDASQSSD